MHISSITFKACHLGNINIDKKQAKQISQQEVALVQLNPNNSKDLDSVMALILPWGGFDSYTLDITNDMHNIFTGGYINKNNPKFLAITTQKDNFETLESEKILGITEITEPKDDVLKIDFIETEPNSRFKTQDRQYIHIGKSLVRTIIELTDRTYIITNAIKENINFFKGLGFKKKSSTKFTCQMFFKKIKY